MLGAFWALLSPVLLLVAIALIFPLLMRVRMENYVVYLFSGLVAWRFLVASMKVGGNSIISSKSLVEKVALPSVLFPIVFTVSEFVNFIFVFIALNIVAFLFGFEIVVHWQFLIPAMLTLLLFGLGLGMFFSVVVVYYRDIKHVLDVVAQGFFYLTPIIYPASLIPDEYSHYMLWNPFAHYVELFHQAIYYRGSVDWALFSVPLMLSLATLFLGLVAHAKWGRSLVYHV